MSDHNSFEEASQDTDQPGLIGDFIGFMRENAKWWLIPFLAVFLLLGIVLILGGTGAAPFIYAMF